MKRRSFLYAAALLAITLTGCSSSDPVNGDVSNTDTDLPSTAVNSNVKILLSSKAESITRASIESDDQQNFEQKGLHIFCLATRQMENGLKFPIDWSQRTANSYSVWMDNVKANATIKTDGNAKEYTDIEWADGKIYYYPTGNGHSYSFYGIYPEADSIKYESTAVTAKIPVNGYTDVLWGAAENLTDYYAYSAKYFRQHPETNGTAQMNFKHAFMRLKFSIKAGKDANGSFVPASKTGIKSLSVANVPRAVQLRVADATDRSNEGKVVGYIYNNVGVDSVSLRDLQDQIYPGQDAVYPKATGEETLLDGAVIVPLPPTGSIYTMNINLEEINPDGTKRVTYHAIRVPIELANGRSFEAGHSYTIHITVYSSTKVMLNAKLARWIEDDSSFKPTTGEAI